VTSETKQCTKCGEEKPATLEYFYKKGDGFYAECKVCAAERDKARYEANKGTILEQKKAYREANKEAIVERGKAYREANKEAIAERGKAYREANKEAIAERRKAYYEANKEAIAERRKAYYRTPKGKFRHIKKGAKDRNINFSLPFDLYESQLWGKPCHYCGCDIEITGLDRKDNDKGYEVGNVVPSCQSCNAKKYDKPYEEFIAKVKNER